MGVTVDCHELKEFADKVGRLAGAQREAFFEEATKAMAGRLLALVIPRTPVGKEKGGTLRRGWTGGVESSSVSLNVERAGAGTYTVTVTNPVEYASYVEYGHRQTPGRYVPAIGKRLVASWVNGQFFLRTSEEELSAAAPSILQPLLDAYLRQVF